MTLVTCLTRVLSLTGHVTIVTRNLSVGRVTADKTLLPPHAPDLLDLLGVGDDQEVSSPRVVNPPLLDQTTQCPVDSGSHVSGLTQTGEVSPELLQDLRHVGSCPGHLKLQEDPANGVTQRNSRTL